MAAAFAAMAFTTTAASNSAASAGCNFEVQGDGHVSAVIDARTFRLQDGREVHLAGIEPATRGSDNDGAQTLAALIADRDVTLRGDGDTPDRWGRQLAFVFLDQGPTSVQSLLLTQGAAFAAASVADKGCAAELAAAESAAMKAKRGVWADAKVIKNAESPGDILARIGQFTLVEGKVSSVRQAGATFYVNFGRRWTQDFAVTIPRRNMASFETAGLGPKSFENQRIRVRGWIEQRGGPRIEVVGVGQIEVIGEK